MSAVKKVHCQMNAEKACITLATVRRYKYIYSSCTIIYNCLTIVVTFYIFEDFFSLYTREFPQRTKNVMFCINPQNKDNSVNSYYIK